MEFFSSAFITRSITGVLIAAFALFCTIYSHFSFYALVLIAALLMYSEWLDLTRYSRLLNRFGGLIYVGIPVWSLLVLRGTESAEHILSLFAMVWATDIAAYIGGSRYGKHKIWPSISPGKSWEGLACGVLAAALAGAVASYLANFPDHPFEGLLVGAILALISQCGDFFESWIKRNAGVKDSGNLLPGHGGVMDRVDGLVFAAPAYALLIMALAD